MKTIINLSLLLSLFVFFACKSTEGRPKGNKKMIKDAQRVADITCGCVTVSDDVLVVVKKMRAENIRAMNGEQFHAFIDTLPVAMATKLVMEFENIDKQLEACPEDEIDAIAKKYADKDAEFTEKWVEALGAKKDCDFLYIIMKGLLE